MIEYELRELYEKRRHLPNGHCLTDDYNELLGLENRSMLSFPQTIRMQLI